MCMNPKIVLSPCWILGCDVFYEWVIVALPLVCGPLQCYYITYMSDIYIGARSDPFLANPPGFALYMQYIFVGHYGLHLFVCAQSIWQNCNQERPVTVVPYKCSRNLHFKERPVAKRTPYFQCLVFVIFTIVIKCILALEFFLILLCLSTREKTWLSSYGLWKTMHIQYMVGFLHQNTPPLRHPPTQSVL